MTEQELKLAQRLYAAGIAAGGPSPSTRKRSKFWLAVTAEVLRLMEWSRRDGFTMTMERSWDECACDVREYGSHDSSCHRVRPLTLPPDDWTP